MRDWLWRAVLILCVALLSGLILFVQLRAIAGTRFGYVDLAPAVQYLEQNQLSRHLDVLQGTAPSPWQYRLLSPYIAHYLITMLGRWEIDHPIALGFMSLRFIQNVLILLLAILYYARLGIGRRGLLMGLSLVAWGMSQAIYDSGASLDIYSELIFYLLAALAILYRKDYWILAIAPLAALNRETSLLIPFMLAADRFDAGNLPRIDKRTAAISSAALASSLIVFFGLRIWLGSRPLAVAYGNEPGLELLVYNVGRTITWVQLLATVALIPIIAFLSIRNCPHSLRRFFWVLVPVWLVVHLFLSVIAETRLLLVPYVVAFVPAAILGVSSESRA